MARFCSSCGAALNDGARFCHVCGVAVGSVGPLPRGTTPSTNKLFWAPTVVALVAVLGLVALQAGNVESAASSLPENLAPPSAPDISQMSPQERADRLFDRVMRLSEEGKKDSVSVFAPMAMLAIEAIGPLDNHRRYDVGLVALVSDDLPMATAQADTILKSRPTHLLGLMLAAKSAVARGDNAGAAKFWQRLLAAESAELAAALPEYQGHMNDILAGVERAKKR
jgi:hypothetical protein